MKKKVLTVLCAAMVAASCFAAQTGTASAAHMVKVYGAKKKLLVSEQRSDYECR